MPIKRKPKKSGRKISSTRTVLSLFTGAGGLDLGLEAAGFKTALCVEIDRTARKTLRANRPKWELAEPGDVNAIAKDPAGFLEDAGINPGELALLAGGPPCQPFSKAGYWSAGDSRRLRDPRAKTLRAYLKIVEHALPEVLLLENVRGLAYQGKDEGLRLLRRTLARINRKHDVSYKPVILHVNAADYGIPQLRERVFVVAHRGGKGLALPTPTHGPKSHGDTAYTTAWDAIGDLDTDIWPGDLQPAGKWADLLPSIPEGENYLWHTPKGGGMPLFGWRTRYWSFLLKLAKDRPSWTIQAQPGPAVGPFHWRSRKLSVRELCRLQTFPDDYEIKGTYREAYMQLGNAVPPALGELLGLEIRRHLLGERPRRQLRLIPIERHDCPAPERRCPVPNRYHSQQDDYADHPGTGKGPGARKRAGSAA